MRALLICAGLITVISCKNNASDTTAAKTASVHDQTVDARILKQGADELKKTYLLPEAKLPGLVDVVATRCPLAWSAAYFPSDPNLPTAGGLHQDRPSIQFVFATKADVMAFAQHTSLLGSETQVFDVETNKSYTAHICGGLRP